MRLALDCGRCPTVTRTNVPAEVIPALGGRTTEERADLIRFAATVAHEIEAHADVLVGPL
jgi:hypothetical protein